MPQGHARTIGDGDILPRQPFATINEQITAIALHPPYRRNWWIGILISGAMVGLLVVSIGWLFLRGVGIWD